MKAVIPVPSASIPGIESLCVAYMRGLTSYIPGIEPTFASGSGRSSDMLDRLGVPHLSLSCRAWNTISAVACVTLEAVKSMGFSDGEAVLVLPPFWWPTGSMSLDRCASALEDRSVLAVQLSGWKMAHADGTSGYVLLPHSEYFFRIASMNNACCHVLDPTRPMVARAADFADGGPLSDLSHGGCVSILHSTNFGHGDSGKVLFPAGVSISPHDGLPEPFVDVVGIDRRYGDRCPSYDSVISNMSGIEFKSKFF